MGVGRERREGADERREACAVECVDEPRDVGGVHLLGDRNGGSDDGEKEGGAHGEKKACGRGGVVMIETGKGRYLCDSGGNVPPGSTEN